MKELFLRCALVFSVLVAISPCNRINSCYSGPAWGDTRAVFFNPELGEDSTGLKPFFYSYQYLFPNDYDGYTSLGEKNTINDYRLNCQEWRAYLGGKIDLEDIYRVIYGSSADSFATALKTQTLNEFLPGNTFMKALQKPANAAALHYLDFAKRFEFQQFESAGDPWEEPRYHQHWFRQDSVMLDRLAEESVEGLAKASDPFLQQRWAYQRINVFYYKGVKGGADSITQTFQKYFDLRRDKTILLPWALLKVAEVNPNPNLANYQLALVFERCQSKRLRAMQLFQSESAEKALPYTRNAQEKAAVLTLRAIRNPGRGLHELKYIARLSPESPYLPLLLTREINKVEDWLMTKRLTGLNPWHSFEPPYDYDDNNYDQKLDRWRRMNVEKDRQYLHALRSAVAQMEVNQRRQPKRAPFLQLALAHLYYMEQRPADAWRTLQAIRTKDNIQWQLQKNIQEVLLLPQRTDVRRPAVQAALYKRLHYIREHTSLLSEPAQQLSRIYLALSHAYLSKKDVVTAGLLFGRASRYTATFTEEWWTSADAQVFYDNLATLKDLEALERLLLKKEKTPFENLITQPFQEMESSGYSDWSYYGSDSDKPVHIIPADKLHELMGTFALRDGHLKRAAAEFAKVDTVYWGDYYGTWSVDICGSIRFIAADTLLPLPGNNKYTIVRKMLDLQEEAIRNPAKRAENYYLLGNAWFQCSYWGIADGMLALHGSSSETDVPYGKRRGPAYLSSRPDLARYGNMYYRCTRAAAYFRKSLAARPDRELAARAYYMLAECDRRDRWMTMRRRDGNEGGVASPMFKTWAKRYGKTTAYKECLDACPDLRTYLGK